MRRPTRTPRAAAILESAQRAEAQLSLDQLATAAGVSAASLARLVEEGILEPAAPGTSVFTAAAGARLRRMLRLHADLGIDLADAAIIVDLVERLDRMEAELARLRGGARG